MLTAIASTGFYIAAPQLPGVGDFVQRYFCSHPLERISTVMFFGGLSVLLIKFLRLSSERSVLREFSDADLNARIEAASDDERQQILVGVLDQQPRRLQTTLLFRRIDDSLHYLMCSRRGGLEEHLRYLAELAGEQLHQTYATVRTITWAIPILGFLGTVIGITMAIANVTPDQLDTSLGEVTGGLSVAFDTTALALGMSIVLVFSSFFVERSEQKILHRVEKFGMESLLPWLNSSPAGESSSGQSSAASVGLSAEQIRQQSALWTQQLDEMRSAWMDTMRLHVQQLAQVLDSEVQQTLRLHRGAAEDARNSYTEALQASSAAIVDRTQHVLQVFEDRIAAWQEALLVSSQNSAQQSEALHELGAAFLRMNEVEDRLATSQHLLAENLQALQVAETMERTANSLTAAVHVLTARTTVRAAA
ncbi:MAG: MotA/TolQ/ExbB proton channel family protein [Planctomycetaceae bacterium]